MSSRASRRPPNVTCGAAILDSRWRRRKWRQPGLGVLFSIPIEGEVQNGGPSASGGHLGLPHLRNRKWGHPRWRPEAKGPPFCTSPSIGIEKSTLYYSAGTWPKVHLVQDCRNSITNALEWTLFPSEKKTNLKTYRKISNTRRTKTQNLNDSRRVL